MRGSGVRRRSDGRDAGPKGGKGRDNRRASAASAPTLNAKAVGEREGEGEERRCWDNKKGKYKAKATEERKRVAIARNPSGVLNLHLGMSSPIFSFAISGDGTAFATSTFAKCTIAKPISLVCVPLLCTIHPFFLLSAFIHSVSLLRSCSSAFYCLSVRPWFLSPDWQIQYLASGHSFAFTPLSPLYITVFIGYCYYFGTRAK